MKKAFVVQYNIGRAKYAVSYHNGEKTHPDGSPFYDIALFRNMKKLNEFTRQLTEQGYVYH